MEATISVVGRAAYVAIGAWFLVSVATEIAAAEQATPEMELRTLVEEVELVVSADRKEIGISDQLTLILPNITLQSLINADSSFNSERLSNFLISFFIDNIYLLSQLVT